MTTKCKHWSDGIFPETLTNKNGTEQATTAALKGKRAVGVLFSALWWTPCRAFATDLALFYNASRKWNKKTFEVVFVSSDRNSEAFQDCLNIMPWLAVPYRETAATAKLLGTCKVRDIPALAVFDGVTGEILTTTGCEDVSKATENRGNPRAVVRRWLNRGQKANERELWTLKVAEAMMGIAAVALTVYLKCSYEHNKYTA